MCIARLCGSTRGSPLLLLPQVQIEVSAGASEFFFLSGDAEDVDPPVARIVATGEESDELLAGFNDRCEVCFRHGCPVVVVDEGVDCPVLSVLGEDRLCSLVFQPLDLLLRRVVVPRVRGGGGLLEQISVPALDR